MAHVNMGTYRFMDMGRYSPHGNKIKSKALHKKRKDADRDRDD